MTRRDLYRHAGDDCADVTVLFLPPTAVGFFPGSPKLGRPLRLMSRRECSPATRSPSFRPPSDEHCSRQPRSGRQQATACRQAAAGEGRRRVWHRIMKRFRGKLRHPSLWSFACLRLSCRFIMQSTPLVRVQNLTWLIACKRNPARRWHPVLQVAVPGLALSAASRRATERPTDLRRSNRGAKSAAKSIGWGTRIRT
jgi:hypothetical protein